MPVKVLSRVFRAKFLDPLQRAAGQHRPDLSSTVVHTLLKHDWVVHGEPAFGGPSHLLRYPGRYTHRVAISNQRLLNFDGHSVRFRSKDDAHGNKQRIMTLTAIEFLHRFANMCCPEVLSASASSATSPVPGEPLCSHSLAISSPATSARSAQHQPQSAAWPCPRLRGQHAHRPQPYRATNGLPMQTVRHFLIPSPI